MKKYLCFISLFAAMTVLRVFASDTKTNEWGVVTNGIQMSIDLKGNSEKVTTNEPVILLIRYRNVSTNETVTVYNLKAVALDATYSFVVVSPSGKDISPSLPKSLAGSGVNYSVAPNQTKEFEISLSQLCKFDEPGTYTITTKKMVFSDPKKKWFMVVSNPLKVSVVAGKQ